MRRPTPLPDPYADAPFAIRRAIKDGLTERRLQGSDLRRPYRGVRMLAVAPDTLRARCAAYVQRMPVSGFFSCTTAAQLHGIPIPFRLASEERLHVSVPHPARAPRVRGIVAHSVQVSDSDLGLVDGFPASVPSRTWCELGSLLDVSSLVAAGDHIIHWRRGLSTIDDLRAAVREFHGSRGRGRLREALEQLHDRSESPQESRLRLLLARAGLERVAVNHPIRTSSGHDYRADLAFVEQRVLLEYQGDHHREREQYRSDLSRMLRLQADGWTVVQVGPDDLRSAEKFVSTLRAILTSGSSRH